jgi:hypothetical protein
MARKKSRVCVPNDKRGCDSEWNRGDKNDFVDRNRRAYAQNEAVKSEEAERRTGGANDQERSDARAAQIRRWDCGTTGHDAKRFGLHAPPSLGTFGRLGVPCKHREATVREGSE